MTKSCISLDPKAKVDEQVVRMVLMDIHLG